MTNEFLRLAPAMTWIDANVPPGTRHLALPSDLYTITAYCNEGFACAEEGEDFEPEVLVTALRTRPGRFLSSGYGELALAILTPEALIRTIRAPLSGVVDQRVPLERLCGRSEQRRLRDQLVGASSRADRIERFGRWIESRLINRYTLAPSQERVARATNIMLNGSRDIDLGSLASDLGVTRRQLERDFHQWLGASPSHYARLIRFQRATAAIARGTPIVDAALDCGYADQSHLTRATRKLAGFTPGALQRDTRRQGRPLVRAAMADRLLIGDDEDVIFGAGVSSVSASGSVEHALVVRPATVRHTPAFAS